MTTSKSYQVISVYSGASTTLSSTDFLDAKRITFSNDSNANIFVSLSSNGYNSNFNYSVTSTTPFEIAPSGVNRVLTYFKNAGPSGMLAVTKIVTNNGTTQTTQVIDAGKIFTSTAQNASILVYASGNGISSISGFYTDNNGGIKLAAYGGMATVEKYTGPISAMHTFPAFGIDLESSVSVTKTLGVVIE